MFLINPIPAFKDNYIWVIIHPSSSKCLIVDPGESLPVMHYLTLYQWRPIAILLTHHHPDHTAGVAMLSEHYSIPVYGPMNEIIPAVTNPLSGGELLNFKALNLTLKVLSIPGHTQGHLAYHQDNVLFCGDTLFTGGCGRIFEGTPNQLFHSLSQLAALPDYTLVYCGHEYTQHNLQFAQTIEPTNFILQQRIVHTTHMRHHHIPTVPSTLLLEKQTNPFLRCDQAAVSQFFTNFTGKSTTDLVEIFATLRSLKDKFNP